jgi:putative hydrolase of HD superfamily
MDHIADFLLELDKLKNIIRKTYTCGHERHENSAEHSWHLAMAVLAFGQELMPDLDLLRAIKIALVHDIGEIGAGDISIYSPSNESQTEIEKQYLEGLVSGDISFTKELLSLWREYQVQETDESKLVKVFDRFLPFISNLHTGGKSWSDQKITADQVRKINQVIRSEAPDLYSWMEEQIKKAVSSGILNG